MPSLLVRTPALASIAVVVALAACGGSAGSATTDDLQPIPAYTAPDCKPDPWPLATTLLVGFAGESATADQRGFHLRYQYIAGVDAPDPGCLSATRTNAVGCGTQWWGTWQSSRNPPGAFVRDFVTTAEQDHLLPMFTWYRLLQGSGVAEGAAEVTQAARDPHVLRRYLNDFRFFLLQIRCHRALVHVEPDFWGYAQQYTTSHGGNATTLPAPVRTANPLDCADQPDTIAGLGKCMVAMARRWAPHAKIGLHASGWATNYDCILNTNATLNVAARGTQTGAFLYAAGAASSDFVVVDIADRDAGWREANGGGKAYWINDADGAPLPNYDQAFTWSLAVANAAHKPLLWWQIPVGNMSLSNSGRAWKDNKVAYFFDHPDLVVGSGAVGMAFGAGNDPQTTPESDDGYLISRARALWDGGGRPLP